MSRLCVSAQRSFQYPVRMRYILLHEIRMIVRLTLLMIGNHFPILTRADIQYLLDGPYIHR